MQMPQRATAMNLDTAGEPMSISLPFPEAIHPGILEVLCHMNGTQA
jgi:hypothetical protein